MASLWAPAGSISSPRLIGSCYFHEAGDISKILRPPRGPLVRQEVFQGQQRELDIIHVTPHSLRPRDVKFNAIYRCQKVDTIRRQSDLIDDIRFGEGFGRQSTAWCTKCRKRPPQPQGVGFSWSDPKVDVTSRPGNPVSGNRVPANDKKINVLGGQKPQHLGEVAIHSIVARSTSTRTP